MEKLTNRRGKKRDPKSHPGVKQSIAGVRAKPKSSLTTICVQAIKREGMGQREGRHLSCYMGSNIALVGERGIGIRERRIKESSWGFDFGVGLA
uniref:Uncharacterized protein n=1 Tax=Cannabis sativa TaxID=3483 RepID=A0A803NXL7_CANSA